MWKGLLSSAQLKRLLDHPLINTTTPNKPTLIKTIQKIQSTLAKGFMDIRAQITSLTYPSRIRHTPILTPNPTSSQIQIIESRTQQQSIRSFLSLPPLPSTSDFRTLMSTGNTHAKRPIYPRGSRTSTQTHLTPLIFIPPYIPRTHTCPLVPSSIAPPSLNAIDNTTLNVLSASASSRSTATATQTTAYEAPIYFFNVMSNNGFQSPQSTPPIFPSQGGLDGD
jgi:hypothetical protein